MMLFRNTLVLLSLILGVTFAEDRIVETESGPYTVVRPTKRPIGPPKRPVKFPSDAITARTLRPTRSPTRNPTIPIEDSDESGDENVPISDIKIRLVEPNFPRDEDTAKIPEPPLSVAKQCVDTSGKPIKGQFSFIPSFKWSDKKYCTIGGPGEVVEYRIKCQKASYLDFSIADCCVPGDHWQLKGKSWDVAPNTAVTTSPGPRNSYGRPGRVYNYGGPLPHSPRELDVLVECSYLHGTGLFGAASYVRFESDGVCSVDSNPPASHRIDRSP